MESFSNEILSKIVHIFHAIDMANDLLGNSHAQVSTYLNFLPLVICSGCKPSLPTATSTPNVTATSTPSTTATSMPSTTATSTPNCYPVRPFCLDDEHNGRKQYQL